jgi:hypothetical protein
MKEKICLLSRSAKCDLRDYNGACVAGAHRTYGSYFNIECSHAIDAHEGMEKAEPDEPEPDEPEEVQG